MRTVILIPARHASTRFPGKPLAQLATPEGPRSLIQLSWEAARRVPGIDAVHVVTDDARIRAAAEGFGASVIMTPPECRNGTERCAAALRDGAVTADVIVNLQGDAPLTPPDFVTALTGALAADPARQVATPVLRCDAESHARFVADRCAGRVGATTAVFDATGRALYFSKEVLPFTDPAKPLPDPVPVFHHVGVYAYRAAALAAYADWPESELERLEGLEQLRFLVNGAPVHCAEVAARGRGFWELNNPEDIAHIEAALEAGT